MTMTITITTTTTTTTTTTITIYNSLQVAGRRARMDCSDGHNASGARHAHARLRRNLSSEERFYTSPPPRGGWCTEAYVSILAHLQSLKLLPGGGGV